MVICPLPVLGRLCINPERDDLDPQLKTPKRRVFHDGLTVKNHKHVNLQKRRKPDYPVFIEH